MNVRRIALAVGLAIAAFVTFTQAKKLNTPPPAPVQTTVAAPVVEKVAYVDVLTAREEIPFGTRLTENHFKWNQWPEEALTEGLITDKDRPQAIEELTGGVARSVIYQGEPISERKLVLPGESGLMASLLKPGMRAVTTRISVDTAAGGFIQPGDHVDIILTTTVVNAIGATSGGSRTNFEARTVFENVRVLAIDQTYATTSESGAAVIGSTATFEMTQGDSELLQQAAAQGDLTLTLRPIAGSYSTSARSSAKINRNSAPSSLTIYRNGKPQQVAIRE